jgi:hypothetical protein
MKRFTAIILGVLLVLLIVVSAVALSHHVRKKKLTTTFAKVQVGDTKESVVQTLGQPEEVENCYDSRSNEELTKRCVETYWYMTFLERWGFSFNKDGKVIDKTHNVSF